ncbi:MAG TPA: HAD family hydrolase [Candidatus Hydrogenedentes bacterium]|nr:HAD family hydrolase [Candidatus Hydrogenedentota bacterium]
MAEPQIEVINEVERGRFRHVLFDFDGTVSLLREGWQRIMGPMMIEMICGDTTATPDIEKAVYDYIDESTGVQTIVQMAHLVEMVRQYGRVPPEQVLDTQGYKRIYNDRLMAPVRERIAKFEAGELTLEDVTLRGSLDFIKKLATRDGVMLYVFSGTDLADVRAEAATVGAAPYFKGGIWGALGSLEEYSKEKVLRELIETHDLRGTEVLVVGDGPVEIRNAKAHGCVALGVASDEAAGHGWNNDKRARLIDAGADILIPDFGEAHALERYLFPQ